MVKASTQWLRGLARVGKAQRRTAGKLVKSLFAAPAAKPKAKAKPKPKVAAKPKAAAQPKAVAKPKVAAKARAAPVRRVAKPRTPAPLPGQWLAGYYAPPAVAGKLPGRRLNYFLYMPAKEPSQAMRRAGRPLLVMLHGCDQTASQFAEGTRMNRLAEKKGYAVLYPQQSLSSHPHRCWKWYDRATQEGGGDARLIVGAIEQVAARAPIDRTRIYICGMSAGAGMADIIALRHPELIAAVGLHSGPVYGGGHGMIGALKVMQQGASGRVDGAIGEVLAARPAFPMMPAILIQGEADKVVRPINQAQLARQSLLLNQQQGRVTVSAGTTPAGPAGGRNPAHAHTLHDYHIGKTLLLRVAQIARLEHAWSGGDASLSFNDKAGPDASKMLLDFFARHRRV
ncbi:PHB depolymerase family esterase [Janthinobacterium sp.]|uniref:extracellular catalytic domain type 1 short-chain-length polyhydroxyalkanoate depolymerase n=1 Tax=Janthinobacterium sp. TaxID=1871054 RepID=UPI00293D5401|nr:PHB depolymerase family esterase [Janthinobacterium sp.]